MIYYSTTVTEIGEEVPDLLEGGVLILYADGAPPALAEVSVQHRVTGSVPSQPPPVGAQVRIGALQTRVCAVGSSAWDKVRDMGHVVINFNGAAHAERPGEICVDRADSASVAGQLAAGSRIEIVDALP